MPRCRAATATVTATAAAAAVVGTHASGASGERGASRAGSSGGDGGRAADVGVSVRSLLVGGLQGAAPPAPLGVGAHRQAEEASGGTLARAMRSAVEDAEALGGAVVGELQTRLAQLQGELEAVRAQNAARRPVASGCGIRRGGTCPSPAIATRWLLPRATGAHCHAQSVGAAASA
jgi:uncharacterized small protein (DUF1192 family)